MTSSKKMPTSLASPIPEKQARLNSTFLLRKTGWFKSFPLCLLGFNRKYAVNHLQVISLIWGWCAQPAFCGRNSSLGHIWYRSKSNLRARKKGKKSKWGDSKKVHSIFYLPCSAYGQDLIICADWICQQKKPRGKLSLIFFLCFLKRSQTGSKSWQRDRYRISVNVHNK